MRPAFALAALAFLGTAVAADAPVGAPRIEREADFVQRVNAAIDRGVAWLRTQQATDGSFPNYPLFPSAVTALAYQTLRVCGVPRDDPAAEKAFTRLRATYRRKELQVYTAALILMAIAEHGESVEGDDGERRVQLNTEDRTWAEEVAKALADGQDRHGSWGYDVPGGANAFAAGNGYYDHSNSQYALLGLHAASRCGVAVPREVWQKALDHFLESQELSGPTAPRWPARGAAPREKGRTNAVPTDRARGWGYQSCIAARFPQFQVPTVSMTASGVSSIVICRSELLAARPLPGKLDAESERSAWDGLAWLGRSRFDGRFQGSVDLYAAYAVERAGVLAAVEWMSELDWYGAGAEVLLKAQLEPGGWSGVMDVVGLPDPKEAREIATRVVDTCFALLFLKKGTVPVNRGALTPIGGDIDINFDEGAKTSGRAFEEFLDFVLSRLAGAKDPEVRTRILDRTTAVGPKIVEPLLVRLGGTHAARSRAAHDVLRRATAEDFGWHADAKPEQRDAALAKWQAWWLGVSGRLVYDPAKKLLVAR